MRNKVSFTILGDMSFNKATHLKFMFAFVLKHQTFGQGAPNRDVAEEETKLRFFLSFSIGTWNSAPTLLAFGGNKPSNLTTEAKGAKETVEGP